MDPPVDPPDDPVPEEDTDDRRPIEHRRQTARSGVAASGVAAAFALGLQQVFDPRPVDTVGIEQEAPAKPVDRDKLELRFDPMSSANTVVVVRRPDDA
ncbi:MAG TPA: hypothetical protein VHS52_08735 [Acidimicrobiales bacterium]|nr:hypothetical protein [Acidimicrobiales bacterium]